MRAFVGCCAAIIAAGWLAACAESSIPPRKETFERKDYPRLRVPKTVQKTAPRPEYRMTKDTEIRLDGRPCPYEQVPADASIVHVEVTPGNPPTILAIHFKSKK